MYVPNRFRVDDPTAAAQLIENEPFATLISVVDGEPFLTRAPLIVQSHEPLVLAGHVARANPHGQWLNGSRVLAVFDGPDAYISPRWTGDRSNDVPTWNYTTVHCSGFARVVEGEEKIGLMRRLVEAMEAGAPDAWSMDELAHAQRIALLEQIVAFTIEVDRVSAKFKLSQNSSNAARAGVIDALAGSAFPRDRALAEAMRR